MQVIVAQGCHVLALFAQLTSPSPNVLDALRQVPGFANHALTRKELGDAMTTGYYYGGNQLIARWTFQDIRITLICLGDAHNLALDIIDARSPNGNGHCQEKSLETMIAALEIFITQTNFQPHSLTLTERSVFVRQRLLTQIYERGHHPPGQYETLVKLRTYSFDPNPKPKRSQL